MRTRGGAPILRHAARRDLSRRKGTHGSSPGALGLGVGAGAGVGGPLIAALLRAWGAWLGGSRGCPAGRCLRRGLELGHEALLVDAGEGVDSRPGAVSMLDALGALIEDERLVGMIEGRTRVFGVDEVDVQEADLLLEDRDKGEERRKESRAHGHGGARVGQESSEADDGVVEVRYAGRPGNVFLSISRVLPELARQALSRRSLEYVEPNGRYDAVRASHRVASLGGKLGRSLEKKLLWGKRRNRTRSLTEVVLQQNELRSGVHRAPIRDQRSGRSESTRWTWVGPQKGAKQNKIQGRSWAPFK